MREAGSVKIGSCLRTGPARVPRAQGLALTSALPSSRGRGDPAAVPSGGACRTGWGATFFTEQPLLLSALGGIL